LDPLKSCENLVGWYYVDTSVMPQRFRYVWDTSPSMRRLAYCLAATSDIIRPYSLYDNADRDTDLLPSFFRDFNGLNWTLRDIDHGVAYCNIVLQACDSLPVFEKLVIELIDHHGDTEPVLRALYLLDCDLQLRWYSTTEDGEQRVSSFWNTPTGVILANSFFARTWDSHPFMGPNNFAPGIPRIVHPRRTEIVYHKPKIYRAYPDMLPAADIPKFFTEAP
jgi:hypothetical protein